jgi:hypothetical protein
MHVNAKMIPVETVPGIGERGDEGEQWRGWIKVYSIYYKNFCKCYNVCASITIKK